MTEYVRMKDSHELGLEWEVANPQRATELNDALDACLDITAKRLLYKTFTKDEQNGLMPEYIRRAENRVAQVGTLVKPRNKHGINITCQSYERTTWASHTNLAVVIGHDSYGSNKRILLLSPPWRNKEGEVLHFAEAYSNDLEVVK